MNNRTVSEHNFDNHYKIYKQETPLIWMYRVSVSVEHFSLDIRYHFHYKSIHKKRLLINLPHTDETFEKCSILFKFKKGDNFNHRNTFSILRIALKLHCVQNVEPDTEIGQKGAFCKGLTD